METSQLAETLGQFFIQKTPPSLVLFSKKNPQALRQAARITHWIKHSSIAFNHLLFATSGSTGSPKWIALHKASFLHSAHGVNQVFSLTAKEAWLCPLPLFHVGGASILARSFLLHNPLFFLEKKWNPRDFFALLQTHHIAWTSLVPTQLADLMECPMAPPPSLRGVFLGGGSLPAPLFHKATALGWPLLPTYGMTETSSQVATALFNSNKLHLLPFWEARTTPSKRLMLRGNALLSASLRLDGDSFLLHHHGNGSWFTTEDRAHLTHGILTPLGRCDHKVKILGELVDLSGIHCQLNTLSPIPFALTAHSHLRKGNALILWAERRHAQKASTLLATYNANNPALLRIDTLKLLDSLPKTPLGKLDYQALRSLPY